MLCNKYEKNNLLDMQKYEKNILFDNFPLAEEYNISNDIKLG